MVGDFPRHCSRERCHIDAMLSQSTGKFLTKQRQPVIQIDAVSPEMPKQSSNVSPIRDFSSKKRTENSANISHNEISESMNESPVKAIRASNRHK